MTTASIRIIGAPLDLGQTLRGVDMGTGALRYAGIAQRLRRLGHQVVDMGNIAVPIRNTLPMESEEALFAALTHACRSICRAARQTIIDGHIPIFLGGDHSIAIGTVSGVTHGGGCGVIWIDAHADFNTPATSNSGNIHGMALAVLSGEGPPKLVNLDRKGPKLQPRDVVLIGVRDLDSDERARLKESGIAVYTMRDIDELGISAVMHEALTVLAQHQRIHVSLDMDAVDPSEAPGVGTPVPGGLSYREAHLLMEILADTGKVASLDIVEINPILDERNRTAVTATHLAASLFGKTIL